MKTEGARDPGSLSPLFCFPLGPLVGGGSWSGATLRRYGRLTGCSMAALPRRASNLLAAAISLSLVILAPAMTQALVIYRIGEPFSPVERDSLEGAGIDFREIGWTATQLVDAVELDSLKAGSLQPNFFDEHEDIAATLLNRGGWVGVKNFANINRLIGQVMLDQDPTTAYVWPAISPESFSAGEIRNEQVTFDLGGRFTIREVRLRPSPDRPEQFLEQISLGISDLGFHAGNWVPDFAAIAEVKENVDPEISVVIDPPVSTEAVQLRINRRTLKEIGVADFELFGGGYVTRSSYESDVVDLGDIATFGEIRWSGRRDPKARIDIRTRSGSDAHPEVFWQARAEQQDSVRFLQGGGGLSMTEYRRQFDKLSDFLKPAEPQDWVSHDIENWGFWSSPYNFENPGVDIESRGSRFFQLRADFISTLEDGGKIDYIEFEASVPPAVRRLVGEVFPSRTRVGEEVRFTCFIQATIRSGDNGFDGVEISTPSGFVSIDSVRLAGVDQADFTGRALADGRGFEVILSRKLGPTDSGALLELVFTAPVLREVGTRFSGRIFDSASPHEVRQRILPGNANNEVAGDRMSVTTGLSESLLYSPRLFPNPFSPNGDGINEVVEISYKLLRVTAAVPVAVEVFDLSGRLVKQVYSGENPLGEYSCIWDGTDMANRTVRPGLYVYRIAVDVQADRETDSGLVSVAY